MNSSHTHNKLEVKDLQQTVEIETGYEGDKCLAGMDEYSVRT